MAGLINEMMDRLNDMYVNISELTELAHEKKDIIIKNDTEALKAVTAKENTFVGRFQKAEKAASLILDDIATVLNQNRAELSLSKLGELIKEQEDYGAYTEIYNKLKQGMELLKERNSQNNLLIENALDYIDYTVNVLRSTYGSGESGVLDTRN